ncbi:hypothetical protein [Frigoriflavimonas asaccharolytica]|uniref:Uncharacterized protein n=1 Tax=Frigoriflavimonas asaccharolytica TaxID=2735899 RepID=A0A8J8KCV2_9FLAO|nr:hypothetical protein [Frigoriflavimonas asaccharolytica]NRS94054.1 hypothetical protein [Frigoriflavimonas asaccharolytica]
MKILILSIAFFFTSNTFVYSQIKTSEFDVNMDGKVDKVKLDTISNIYTFFYTKDNIIISKKIDFFKNYAATTAVIDMRIKDDNMTFKISYAPKYNDFDIVNFTYLKNKDDWYLSDILTHRFNPLDKNLISTECNFKNCKLKKISLRKNNFEMIQQIVASTKNKKCRSFSEE